MSNKKPFKQRTIGIFPTIPVPAPSAFEIFFKITLSQNLISFLLSCGPSLRASSVPLLRLPGQHSLPEMPHAALCQGVHGGQHLDVGSWGHPRKQPHRYEEQTQQLLPVWAIDYIHLIPYIPGGRYSVFSDGELLIANVSESDASQSFRCLAKHKLTGEKTVSSIAGR